MSLLGTVELKIQDKNINLDQLSLQIVHKIFLWVNKQKAGINYHIIKVCFCPQKRMSPPVPQTIVKGKKSI